MDPKLITDLGLPIALVIYLLWRDNRRSQEDEKVRRSLMARIQALEDELHGELRKMIRRAESTSAAATQVMRDLIKALRIRPCLLPQDQRDIDTEPIERANRVVEKHETDQQRGVEDSDYWDPSHR